MARPDPTPGKWAWGPSPKAEEHAEKLHDHEARKGFFGRTPAQVRSLKQQSEAARRGRN